MTDEMTPEDKIKEAQIKLISRLPFYGSLVLHLTFKECPEYFPTMGVTPYGKVYYNPKYVASLSTEEVQGVIVHEVMHVCLLHLERLGTRNRLKSNYAMDYVVNGLISKDFKLPKGVLLDSKYDNMCWEKVYDMLPESKTKECTEDCSKCPVMNGKGRLSEDGDTTCKHGVFDRHITKDELEKATGEGDGIPKDGKGGASDSELKGMGLPTDVRDQISDNQPNWRKILTDAYSYAKNVGSLPAGMDRLIEDLTEPKLNWRELVSQFLTRSMPFNFSYRRPARKSISSGFYIPNALREEIEVTMVIDTSGSMGEGELRDCMSEVLGLLRTFDRVKITLFSCDAQLSDASTIGNEYDISTTRLVGGGGTSYRPMFKKIMDRELDTKILVYLGDMYAEFPLEGEVPIGLTTIFIVTKTGDPKQVPPYFKYVVQLED